MKAPAMTIANGSPSRRLARERVSIYILISIMTRIYILKDLVPGLLSSSLTVSVANKRVLCKSSWVVSLEPSLLS